MLDWSRASASRPAHAPLTMRDVLTAMQEYGFTKVRGLSQEAMTRLRGELTLLKATPDISRVRIFTPAAFDPLPLVRV